MKRGASIRHRVFRLVMTTSLVALLVSAAALLLYELRSQRAGWEADLQTQTDLLSEAAVPALLEADEAAARDSLALSNSRLQFEVAALYDTQGRLFAAQVAPRAAAPPARLTQPATGPPSPVMAGSRLSLQQPVQHDGRWLGTIAVQATYDVLPRLLHYLAILGAVTLASLGMAAIVARRLQRTITEPIVAAADVARQFVQTRDFALRAPRTSNDEVGALVDAFNEMLGVTGAQAAELQAIDRRRNEFLATLAHELRNPLAPVTTALSILRRPDTEPATRARMLEMMQRQTDQLVRLIDDLMEVSRISTGRLALRTEKLELNELLRAAIAGITPALQERRQRLEVQWPAPVWLQGDRMRLVQVFSNLLANAVRYTDTGGCIGIVQRRLPQVVEVEISDTGMGIAPELQGEVFQMFYQVDRTSTGQRTGLGVGLPLARQLVKLHGGELTLLRSAPGQGSVFNVRLPVLKPEDGAATPAPNQELGAPAAAPAEANHGARHSPPPGHTAQCSHHAPLHVLLADDNRDFADSMAAALNAAGYSVTLAYDGQSALRAARHHLPDVGLFDIGMPELDGNELAGALRRLPGGQRCLLMAVSGWGQPSDQETAHRAGFDEHLVKPVDMEALLRRMAEHVPAMG